jgi:hypothetical protein
MIKIGKPKAVHQQGIAYSEDVKALKKLSTVSGVINTTELIRLAIRIAVAHKARFPKCL